MRLELRTGTSLWMSAALPLVSIAAALGLCAVLVVAADASVVEAYAALAAGAFGSRFNAVETLVKAAPLTLTGLAAAVAFRARFGNIGGEGQLLAGAMAAAYVGALASPPAWSLPPLMLLAAAAAGAAWAGVPALLKLKLRCDEVVSSLMLNFIMFYAMMALLSGPWKDPLSGYPDSPDIRMDAEFPILLEPTRLHLGVAVALFAAVAVWLVMSRSTLGFAVRAVGDNPRAAAHGGVPVARTVLVTVAISGALAGLAGAGEVGGLHFQVMATLSPGYGYSGIVVAMLAQLNPLGVVPAAVFFAAVATGAESMSRATGVPVFLADVMQGAALLCMLVGLMFTTYRVRLRPTG